MVALGAVAAALTGCGGEGADPAADQVEAIASVLEESYAEDSPEYAVQQLVSGYKNDDQLLIDGFSAEDFRNPQVKSIFDEFFSNVLGIGEARVLNDLANVDIDVSPPLLDTTVVFSLRLQRNGEAWQLAGIDNADEVDGAINARREWAVERANEQLQAYFSRAVVLGFPTVGKVQPSVYYSGTAEIIIPITNRTGFPITSGELKRSPGFDFPAPMPLYFGIPEIAPGETGNAVKSIDANVSDEARFRRQYESLPSPGAFVESVSLNADGKSITLRPYRSWADFVRRRTETEAVMAGAVETSGGNSNRRPPPVLEDRVAPEAGAPPLVTGG